MNSRTIQLAEVLTIDRAAASDTECRTLPYVGLEHIEKDAGHFSTDFHRRPETLLATKYRFTAHHVLYGKLRPNLNKVALPDFDGVCTTEILPLLPQPDALDRRYLYAILLSQPFVKWASNSVSGANLPRLDPKRLREYAFELPDLSEQRRIAGRLEQADRLRRTRRYGVELTETFLPTAFLKLFGDPFQNPKDWAVVELGEHIDYLTSGSRGWAVHYADKGDLFLRIQNVGRGRLLLDELTFVRVPDNAEARRTKVRPGDVLLSITADLGRSAPIPKGFPEAYINQHLAIVRTHDLNPVFLSALLSCGAARGKWGSIDRNAVKSGLNFDDIRGFRIIVPPLPLQQEYAALVARADRLRGAQMEALRQAEHLFASLLHRAFRA